MKGKRALIRADASVEIGTGHISRCRTLAAELKRRGWSVAFASRRSDGWPAEMLKASGETVFELSGDVHDERSDAETSIRAAKTASFAPDWVVVDHYNLGALWERVFRPFARVFVIDDLADRAHDCDLLLDQNPSGDGAGRYRALVPPECLVLSGLRYALLREEFKRLGVAAASRKGRIERVLVFYGGSDPTGETMKALSALARSGRPVFVDVVAGPANPKRSIVESFCRERRWAFHSPATRMGDLMSNADLSFGAGGTTAWERCVAGLPAIVTVVADNQESVASAVAQRHAAVVAGTARDVTEDGLAALFLSLCERPDEVRRMSEAALTIVPEPGMGPAKVAAAMEGLA